jgi:hypothetical protein
MKKAILKPYYIIIIILFTANIGFSQTFKTGLTFGVNTSQISGDNLSGFRQFGFSAGGFAKINIDEKKSLQFEILFLQKGSRKNPDPDENDYTSYNLRLNYASVPLLYKIKYNHIVLEIGPYISTLLSYREGDENGPFTAQREFNRFDIGGMFGLSYYFTEKFDFNVRAINSLIPVRDHLSNSAFRLNRGQYNTSVSFSLQYQFNR